MIDWGKVTAEVTSNTNFAYVIPNLLTNTPLATISVDVGGGTNYKKYATSVSTENASISISAEGGQPSSVSNQGYGKFSTKVTGVNTSISVVGEGGGDGSGSGFGKLEADLILNDTSISILGEGGGSAGESGYGTFSTDVITADGSLSISGEGSGSSREQSSSGAGKYTVGVTAFNNSFTISSESSATSDGPGAGTAKVVSGVSVNDRSVTVTGEGSGNFDDGTGFGKLVTDVIVNETSLLLSAEGGNEYGKVVADILSGDHGASVEVEAGSSYGKIDGTAQTANGSLDYSGGAGLDSEGLGFFNAAYKMLHEGLNASINSNASIDASSIGSSGFNVLNSFGFEYLTLEESSSTTDQTNSSKPRLFHWFAGPPRFFLKSRKHRQKLQKLIYLSDSIEDIANRTFCTSLDCIAKGLINASSFSSAFNLDETKPNTTEVQVEVGGRNLGLQEGEVRVVDILFPTGTILDLFFLPVNLLKNLFYAVGWVILSYIDCTSLSHYSPYCFLDALHNNE
ncbi:fibroin heavy chain isoform X2 [Eurytemora carolleeae]|uniref:fibroin heavy chain isoform X2 n=1 Tax=Eurytemora carolleeae TaxID=1294199 RepID=UPI000C7625D1|nr:fibroin heavy chain isoform X2 [Eurytemora carolleeae]|eukprot:XP_023323350.1 fibroin heavy chain-like isoform X2 [Eurytemora affinis]